MVHENIRLGGGIIGHINFVYEILIEDASILQLNTQGIFDEIGINRMLIHRLVYAISLNKKQFFKRPVTFPVHGCF